MKRGRILFFFIVPMFLGCNDHKHLDINDLVYLNGDWQVQGKQQFESWKIVNGDELHGQGYEIIDGNKRILEHLQIMEENEEIVYKATVLDQNEGATISFKAKKLRDSAIEFSNPEHDFPKKIIYDRIHADSIHVTVMGADDGFDFILIRSHGAN